MLDNWVNTRETLPKAKSIIFNMAVKLRCFAPLRRLKTGAFRYSGLIKSNSKLFNEGLLFCYCFNSYCTDNIRYNNDLSFVYLQVYYLLQW